MRKKKKYRVLHAKGAQLAIFFWGGGSNLSLSLSILSDYNSPCRKEEATKGSARLITIPKKIARVFFSLLAKNGKKRGDTRRGEEAEERCFFVGLEATERRVIWRVLCFMV